MPRVLHTGPARHTHVTTQVERTLLGVSVLQEGDMVPNLNTGKAELGPPRGGGGGASCQVGGKHSSPRNKPPPNLQHHCPDPGNSQSPGAKCTPGTDSIQEWAAAAIA